MLNVSSISVTSNRQRQASVIVYVRYFLAHYKRATLCAIVSNLLFRCILLQTFIAFLCNVCSETGWYGPSFTHCSNSCRVCSIFSSKKRGRCFWSLCVIFFSKHSCDAVLHGHQGYTIPCRTLDGLL